MKKNYLFIALCAIFLTSVSNAQYYVIPWTAPGQNPGGLNQDSEFPVGGGLDATWTTIATGPTTGWSSARTIPFGFDFNGTSYTSYYVHPSGVVTFTSTPTKTPTVRENLPSSNVPDNSICVLGVLIDNSGDYIVSKTFGVAPNRQHWIQFNSATSPGTQNGWVYASIVLEETSNKIYVVDQRINCVSGQQLCQGRPQLSVGLQIDSATAVQPPYLTSYEGMAGNDASPDDNAYMEFVPGTQPTEDLAMLGIDVAPFLGLPDAPFTITGRIRNVGSASVSNYQLNYSVNGGATVTDNITQNVGPLSTVTYNSITAWNPSASGDYQLRVWVSNPNGNTDGDPSNDELTSEVTILDTVIQRKPLYEIFTSSTCGPCRPGNVNFHSIVDPLEGEFVAIKYQQDFPGTGDPYCTDEAVERRGYYAVNSIPRMEIDGGWDQNASSFTLALHEESKGIPAFVSMELDARVDASAKKVSFYLEIESFTDLGNVTLQVAIVEGITFQNIKSNGETEFENVMRKMLPSENGRVITLNKGDVYDLQEDYVFNGNFRLPADGAPGNRINHNFEHSIENFNDLYVIAWVQNDNTLEVFQAVDSRYSLKTSVNEVIANTLDIDLYPNPSNSFTNLAINASYDHQIEVTVLNAVGAIVNSTRTYNVVSGNNVFELPTENLASGFYFITVNDGNSVITKKLIKR